MNTSGILSRGTCEEVRPRTVTAVQNFSEPKTAKEVQNFIGLASYFQKFIEKFAIIARPLYQLLKKDAIFKFGEAERTTFQMLKLKLTEVPILAIYNPECYTELHCDASIHVSIRGNSTSTVFKQKMHPIFYFRTNNNGTKSPSTIASSLKR